MVSHPVRWHPSTVVTCSSPFGHPPRGLIPCVRQSARMESLAHCGLARCGPNLLEVPTLVPDFPLRLLMLLGMPLLGSEDHPTLCREIAGDDRLFHLGSPVISGGHPYPVVAQNLGPATKRDLISNHNLGPVWSQIESGVGGMSFESHVAIVRLGSWEETKGLGVRQRPNCLDVPAYNPKRPLNSPTPPSSWPGT
jgi:hypothetical protein